ncbi:shufflon system plasmid conjugative transfer pilus tip adhesin PilV [Komagataeibacter sp. FNDCR2]|uniref:shufflon system plasmid conjugative transfer pilus tip adhesin PilV n=1 Tax=Komagataeibacter sp. FNDCR2 TaxID=2878682 RepID=UPI001E4C3836|nr:shufflon system plasmid conjugative transfer pilus tip adhesin PilV [Komagataeibacter sp. FNDCR2]MCE2576656.1 shufflon system plasmid conjugative transfer pilus tip adhesin PilV [Komagataeibacter sp. FNDCR2]
MENIAGAIIAAIVGMMILPHFQSMVVQNTSLSTDATTSGQFRSLLEAGQKYTDKHSESLFGSVPVNGAPVTLPLSTLVSDSDLLPGFTTMNPFGQTWVVYLLQPTQGTLSVVVETQGGTTISGVDEVRIASGTGEQGGFVPYDGMFGNLNSSTATGASRSWSLPLTSIPNPGPGHLVGLLQYSNAPVMNADYLYRDQVQGHPEFQTMNAPLNMDGNNINAANDVNATRGIFSGGNPNGGYGGVKVGGAYIYGDDTDAAVRAPDSGAVYMQHPNGQLADLQAAQGHFSLNIGTNGMEPDAGLPPGLVGGVHSVDGYFEGSLALGQGGAKNVVFDNAGRGSVAQSMTAGTQFIVENPGCGFQVGNTQFCGDAYNTWINTPGTTYFHHADGTNADISAGSATVDDVKLGTDNGAAAVGGGCSPNGMIAQETTGDGATLSCMNGVWKRISSSAHVTWYLLAQTPGGYRGPGNYLSTQYYGDLGEHLMCALTSIFEEGTADPHSVPNATRVMPVGAGPNGGLIWSLQRGNDGSIGGSAACLDLNSDVIQPEGNAYVGMTN